MEIGYGSFDKTCGHRMLSEDVRRAIRALIDREVVPAVGCTEPVAVALATARATELARSVPASEDASVCSVNARLSGNIVKNAMGVGIPGTGMTGLPIAIGLGAVIGDSSRGLEVLGAVTPENVEQARILTLKDGGINIELAEDADDILYIDVEVCLTDGHRGRAVISGGHDRFVRTEADGAQVGDMALESGRTKEAAQKEEPELSLRVVWD
ncbi:MAG: hypothetical protein K2K84_08170, partial [Muribaculaceae bacterium]|nr:hypothetical protein [Muribaculaceae bacterium]